MTTRERLVTSQLAAVQRLRSTSQAARRQRHSLSSPSNIIFTEASPVMRQNIRRRQQVRAAVKFRSASNPPFHEHTVCGSVPRTTAVCLLLYSHLLRFRARSTHFKLINNITRNEFA